MAAVGPRCVTWPSMLSSAVVLVRRLRRYCGRSQNANTSPNPRSRISIRLGPVDRLLLCERATSRGMPSATYAAVLVRSHLRKVTPLPSEELAALKRSIAELGAIGRNLNQIATALNAGGRLEGPGRQHVELMLKIAVGLRDHVKALLIANETSWERGYAETTH